MCTGYATVILYIDFVLSEWDRASKNLCCLVRKGKEQNENNTKSNTIGFIFGNRVYTAIFYRTDSTNRQYAFADAYPGIFMWIIVWLGVRTGSRIDFTSIAKFDFWHAAIISNVHRHGGVIGYVYSHAKWQCIKQLYIALFISMVAGRVVWALATCLLVGFTNVSAMMLINGALLSAIPGIVVQLILIPMIMATLDKTKVVPFKKLSKVSKTQTM